MKAEIPLWKCTISNFQWKDFNSSWEISTTVEDSTALQFHDFIYKYSPIIHSSSFPDLTDYFRIPYEKRQQDSTTSHSASCRSTKWHEIPKPFLRKMLDCCRLAHSLDLWKKKKIQSCALIQVLLEWKRHWIACLFQLTVLLQSSNRVLDQHKGWMVHKILMVDLSASHIIALQ